MLFILTEIIYFPTATKNLYTVLNGFGSVDTCTWDLILMNAPNTHVPIGIQTKINHAEWIFARCFSRILRFSFAFDTISSSCPNPNKQRDIFIEMKREMIYDDVDCSLHNKRCDNRDIWAQFNIYKYMHKCIHVCMSTRSANTTHQKSLCVCVCDKKERWFNICVN